MENSILKPAQIREAIIKSGETKANLKTLQMFLLGIFAGGFIALGGAVSTIASHSIKNVGLSKLVSGLVFPVGLILVIMCGAELFTGNSLMVISKLEKKISTKQLLKNWLVVYISNFVGSFIISFLVFYSGMLNLNLGKVGGAVIKTAVFKSNLNFGNAFVSGILCNLLVCLAVWGATASKDVIGKVFMAWFPIMTFVTCGFEHCVANMYYLTLGLLAKTNPLYIKASNLSFQKISSISGLGILKNLIPVTLGNIIGGTFFVGTMYYLIYRQETLCNNYTC